MEHMGWQEWRAVMYCGLLIASCGAVIMFMRAAMMMREDAQQVREDRLRIEDLCARMKEVAPVQSYLEEVVDAGVITLVTWEQMDPVTGIHLVWASVRLENGHTKHLKECGTTWWEDPAKRDMAHSVVLGMVRKWWTDTAP